MSCICKCNICMGNSKTEAVVFILSRYSLFLKDPMLCFRLFNDTPSDLSSVCPFKLWLKGSYQLDLT